MDIFNRQPRQNYRQPGEEQIEIPMVPNQQWMPPVYDARPPLPSRGIEHASGIVKRIFMLVLFIAGLATTIALLFPGLRFVYEFSKWAYKEAGYLF